MLFLLYRDGKRNILPHTPCSFHCKHCAYQFLPCFVQSTVRINQFLYFRRCCMFSPITAISVLKHIVRIYF